MFRSGSISNSNVNGPDSFISYLGSVNTKGYDIARINFSGENQIQGVVKLLQELDGLQRSLAQGAHLLEKASGLSPAAAYVAFQSAARPSLEIIDAVKGGLGKADGVTNFASLNDQLIDLKTSIFGATSSIKTKLLQPAPVQQADVAGPSHVGGESDMNIPTPGDRQALNLVASWINQEEATGVFVPLSEFERGIADPVRNEARSPNVGSPGFFDDLDRALDPRLDSVLDSILDPVIEIDPDLDPALDTALDLIFEADSRLTSASSWPTGFSPYADLLG